MLILNTTNTTDKSANIRGLENLFYNILSVGLPFIALMLSDNKWWIAAIPLINYALGYAKQKGWLPTTLTVK